ncbi:MAG: phospholipase D family protein, partial [Pseudomonadota bacterium]
CLWLLAGTGVEAQALTDWIDANCAECTQQMATETGAYILEKGEESLLGRAWLTQHATKSIDVQYFIWSTDNVGILAGEYLLSAAERGVKVRVLVDDILVDAADESLLLLSAHPNSDIRIYNPNITVGVSLWQKIKNLFGDFRAINQRMHDKTAIFDGIASITGGRNMADEYFDFNHHYNFRDRDILLVGRAVGEMTENFEEFWESDYAVPVEEIFADELADITDADIEARARHMHAYAADPKNFTPQVRAAINATGEQIEALFDAMVWDDMRFISDIPGKNAGDLGLAGGGESTRALIAAVARAKESILMQTPYLVMPEGGVELLSALVKQGVRVRISTNSLASTDNVQAFSGYANQRKALLDAGIEIYEYKARPAIRESLVERYPAIAEHDPVFALHAKSLVIDERVVYIGTFNLDPRSANLNTEVGVLVDNEKLGRQLTDSIERDIHPDNSWQTTPEFDPDGEVSRGKRMKIWFYRALPLEPVL